MATVHPSWKRSGRQYEQRYGFQEELYSKIAVPPGERGPFLMGASVSFKYTGPKKDLAPVFRQAWIQMRRKYPAIAALTTDRGKFYKSPSKDELEAWVEDTFKVQRETTGPEVFRDLTKTEYMTLHYLPESSQIFLQAEHHQVDSWGVMHFWDSFFRAVVAPKDVEFGDEIDRLPPRTDDLVDLDERSARRGKSLALELLEPLDYGDPICLPANTNATPSRNFSAELKLGVRATAATLRACEEKKVSLTAVWHTAMALATRDVQGSCGRLGRKFSGFSNFNVREYFPESKDPDAHTVGCHHTVLPFAIEPSGKSFDDLARQLTMFYRKGLSDPPDVMSALKPMVEEITPLFTSGPMTDSTPAVSSLGNVDPFIRRRYGMNWDIEDVWFGDTVTGPWIEGFLWAWRDRLVLCCTYNSGYYTSRDVEAFNERVSQIMMEGLGLNDQVLSSRL